MSGKQRLISEIDNHKLEFQNVEKLFGIDIYSTLTLENDISKISKKNTVKLNAMARIYP